jgi:hypothetical protein
MGEVQQKADKIKKKSKKEENKLAADPIKVVRGPGGQLFVTDHHHGARAWLLAGYSSGICSIESDPSSSEGGLDESPKRIAPRTSCGRAQKVS